MIEKLGLSLLHRFDPETAHGLSIRALKWGLAPLPGRISSPVLATEFAGLKFDNPLGLAAGYDKNAEAARPLSRAGFGFIELGAATPKPQEGNPKPRLYRLRADQAAINRFGFNNQGMNAITARLAASPTDIPRGLNLGANKTSEDRVSDFAQVLTRAAAHIDFATVNISSPNTEKLRDLQGKAALDHLLGQVMAANAALDMPRPIFLKIAPDLTDAELADIAELAGKHGLAAIVATNTTLDRAGLQSLHADQAGGLSGAPLFEKSTRVLAKLSQITQGEIPLIGVGGIGSPEDAFAKIQAGAHALQLYTGMVYQGLSLVPRILKGLEEICAKQGLASIHDARGSDLKRWL